MTELSLFPEPPEPHGSSGSSGSSTAQDLANRVTTRFGVNATVIAPSKNLSEHPNHVATVRSITHDSRRVESGTLFVCVRGGKVDGHSFAADAVRNGAVAVLVDHELADLDAVQIVVDDTRACMGPFAAAFYGFPGDHLTLVGVTGTNGKTTTAHTLESILLAAGKRVGVIGTLTQKRTTPEATDVQERLAELRAEGCEIVVMEVTSHALELQRVRGLRFAVSIFTNLSQDHLDFHGTIEAYFRAKAKLFTREYSALAIVNVDDRHGRLLADSALIPTERISATDTAAVVLGPTGSSFTWRDHEIRVPIAGPFNVMNAVQAMAAALILGIGWDAIVRGVNQVRVAGRFEPVENDLDFAVYVDFAHTPDGLERVLQAARDSLDGSTGKLISVFGCGGDRDRTKRPQMAAIGQRVSDVAIFTSDNPRSENPEDIVADMMAGLDTMAKVAVVLDRREAIAAALRQARAGDVVVIAGKGHEQGQETNGVVAPFDDRVVVRELLDERGGVA